MLSCLYGKHLATNICYFNIIHGPLLPPPLYWLTSSSSAIWGFCSFSIHWYHFLFFFFLRRRKKREKKKKAPLPFHPLSSFQPHHPSSCFFCRDIITGKLSDTWKNANPEQLEICYYFGKIKTKPFEMYQYIGL